MAMPIEICFARALASNVAAIEFVLEELSPRRRIRRRGLSAYTDSGRQAGLSGERVGCWLDPIAREL
jgi:hypothetical protein